MSSDTRYLILTQEPLSDRFTRQVGIAEVVIGWCGLRTAMKMLRALGYEARRGDPRIKVQRLDDAMRFEVDESGAAAN